MSDLGLKHLYRGKVRDLYEVGEDFLLMVASDRLSAFDVVMDEPIPNKGRVLTGLTNFWVHEFHASVPTALATCDPIAIEQFVPGFVDQTSWHGRTMLARKATMLPLECIVRGRLAGQAYDEYVRRGTIHDMAAPTGLDLTDAFATPLFTPSTKAESGHDININLAAARALVGDDMLEAAQALCLDLFSRAATLLAGEGIVLADTKFELGLVDGDLVVCDEVLTPDSSRFWPSDQIVRGQTPPSFDKQPFRDWLAGQSWDRTPPPPTVPEEVVRSTSERYVAAYERITQRPLATWFGA